MVDEADRLKMASLEQMRLLRCWRDRSRFDWNARNREAPVTLPTVLFSNRSRLWPTDLFPRSRQNCAYRAQRKSGSLRNLSRADPGLLVLRNNSFDGL